jgi:hypothetical protein
MMMSVEQSVECSAGETGVLRENVAQCQLVHQKFHMTRPGLEPGPPRWEANDYSALNGRKEAFVLPKIKETTSPLNHHTKYSYVTCPCIQLFGGNCDITKDTRNL